MRLLRYAFKRFDRFSRRRPLTTNIVTSAIIWGAGDYVAQAIERKSSLDTQRRDRPASTSDSSSSNAPYDFRRTFSCMTFGGLLIAPIGDYWYRWLDATVSRRWVAGSLPFVGVKVLLDTAVFGPFYISSFLLYSVIANGGTLKEAWAKLSRDLVPLVCVDSIIFPPLSAFNFYRNPVRFQILFTNAMSSVDAVLMSYVSACEEGFDAVVVAVKQAMKSGQGGGRSTTSSLPKGRKSTELT